MAIYTNVNGKKYIMAFKNDDVIFYEMGTGKISFFPVKLTAADIAEKLRG